MPDNRLEPNESPSYLLWLGFVFFDDDVEVLFVVLAFGVVFCKTVSTSGIAESDDMAAIFGQ